MISCVAGAAELCGFLDSKKIKSVFHILVSIICVILLTQR